MQQIKIDFDNPGFPQRLDVVENDAQSRFFKAVLYKDGKAYTAPSGATYSIMYRGFGPQNEGWYDTINDGAGKRAACSVSGNVVTCEIARQALRVPGHVSVMLCVTGSNGYMLHGWPIDCNCRNDSYTGGTSVESFFYITQVTNADWTSAIKTWEELKNMIDPTLSVEGKAADAKETGDKIGELKEDLELLIKIKNFNVETAQQNTDYNYSLFNGDTIEVTNKTDGALAVKLYNDDTVAGTVTDYLSAGESIIYTATSTSNKIRLWSTDTGFVTVEGLNTFYKKAVNALNDIELLGVQSADINIMDSSFDVNECIPNRIYIISTSCVNTPLENSIGTLISFARNKKATNTLVQLFFDIINIIYVRYNVYGVGWTKWEELAKYNAKELCKLSLFDNIGVVGDSYASGEIYATDGSLIGDKYKISWIQQLARKNGFTGYNFSTGGLSTRTWLTSKEGIVKLNSSEVCDLYILALGINDYYGLGESYLGVRGDIENGNDTFYGNYAKIINTIKEKAPNSKLMISTIAIRNIESSDTKELIKKFNVAIINIANHYSIPLIRQDTYGYFNSSTYSSNMIHGHPTAVGYSMLATALENCIGIAMVDNNKYFESGNYYN